MTTAATKNDLNALNTELSGKIDDLSNKIDVKINSAVDELSGIMKGFMQQVAGEFEQVHIKLNKHDADISRILGYLDSIEKQVELDETERQVMSLQLTRLHEWVVQAGKQIGLEFKV